MAGVRRPLNPYATIAPSSKRIKTEPGDPEPIEVRFSTAEEALTALSYNGAMMEGQTINVRADETSKDRTKILVEGLPPEMSCEDVKGHFSGAGIVIFAGPPKKPGMGFGGGSFPACGSFGKGGCGIPVLANAVGEVRYETPEEAAQAVALLNGSLIEGARITAILDLSSKDSTKLLLTGVPSNMQWQELKDHCTQAGRVAYVNVKQGPPAGPDGGIVEGMEGEVRYDDPSHTQLALQSLNGSILGGMRVSVRMDPNSKDHTRLLVAGFPASIQWQELKDHFSAVGRVAFAQVKGPAVPDGGSGPILPPMMGNNQFLPWGKGMAAARVSPTGYIRPVMNFARPVMQMQAGFVPWKLAAPQGKGRPPGLGSDIPGSGEVRYDAPLHAQLAVEKLNGSVFQGCQLTVSPDESSQDGSKVVVHGIPSGCQWQDLKDHFNQVGQVAFASIVGPGEVRMETPAEADQAVTLLNGIEVLGANISVTKDRSSKDGTRLVVSNLPSSVNWQQIKDIFSQAGTVAFATRQEAR